MWYIDTMEYYSDEKKTEITNFAGKCVELGKFALSRKSRPRSTNVACSRSSKNPRSKSSDVTTYPGATAETRKEKGDHSWSGTYGEQKRGGWQGRSDLKEEMGRGLSLERRR